VAFINEHGDYAYVDLQSVEFYLSKRCRFVEYSPPQSGHLKIHTDVGYSLSFSFKHKWGNSSTFGKDKNIFG